MLDGSEKTQRLAALAGVETVLHPSRRNVDDVHRPVALAGHEQLVTAERHVHGLAADLDGALVTEARVDQADRIALQAGDADHAVVRTVTGDLRSLRNVLQS